MSTVYVVHRDSEGNCRSEALELNPALLAILRFRRKNPTAICTVELIEQAPNARTSILEMAAANGPAVHSGAQRVKIERCSSPCCVARR